MLKNIKNKNSNRVKLIYITNARIPTEKAHGLQIMKMCEAFASLQIKNQKSKVKNTIQNSKLSDNFDVQLIIPRRVNSIRANAFEYYGVRRIFGIKRIFSIDLFWLKILPVKISFYVQWFSFAIFASIYAILKYQKTGNIFYSRDVLILFFLCLFGFEPVAEIHDYKAEKPKKWWLGYAMRKVKKIITNSEGTENFLRQHYPVPEDKFLVASNGVDVDFFSIKESKKEARNKLNLPPEKSIISYIGRLETLGTEKGVSDLIEAFGQLAKERADVLLLVIGGPEKLVAKYKKKAALLGLANEQIIFTGQVSYGLIPLYLRAIDIVVVPFPRTKQFAFTSSPIKIFEFMAAGKIITASDLPALREILSEKNALFFESENPGDLFRKLAFILDNPGLAAGLSSQASLDAKNYSWLNRAQKIMMFLKK